MTGFEAHDAYCKALALVKQGDYEAARAGRRTTRRARSSSRRSGSCHLDRSVRKIAPAQIRLSLRRWRTLVGEPKCFPWPRD